MAEEKVKELTEKMDKVVSDIYNYIKCVDEKVVQNDNTLKFMTSQQAEQMKELIQSKTDNLRRFFEEAIRLQTEIVRNTYETIISELKLNYEQDIKNKDIENLKIYNQKLETLKASYENQITAIKDSMNNDCEKKLNDCYANAKAKFDTDLNETIRKYEVEKADLIEKSKQTCQQTADKVYADAKIEFEKIIKNATDEVYTKTKEECEIEKNKELEDLRQNLAIINAEKNQQTADEVYTKTKEECEIEKNRELEDLKQNLEIINAEKNQKIADEVYQKTKTEYEERIAEINSWHESNLRKKIDETQRFFEEEMKKRADNSYENGKSEALKWCEDEMTKRSQEAYENGKAEVEAWHLDVVRQKLEVQAQYFEEEIEKAKIEAAKQMKLEMYAEMDEAARRNEEELKLFLDYYEAKIKPFKKLINIHETTDRRIKDIQRRIKNKINKTLGNKDAIIPPDNKYDEYKAKEKKFEIQNEEQ